MWKAMPWSGGTRWYDLSGKGNHGTLTNGPAWNAGRDGLGAMSFDGVNDYVDLGTRTEHVIPTGIISVWVYARRSASHQFIFGKDNSGSNSGDFALLIKESDDAAKPNYLWSYIDGGAGTFEIYSNSAITENIWTHIAVKFGIGGLRMYVNGLLQDNTSAETHGMTNSVINAVIGSNYAGSSLYFTGILDDVRIYNRALSADEIAAQYEDSRTGRYELFRYVNRNAFWSVAASAFNGSPWNYYAQL
jgi:hypothetical protein